MEATTKDGVPFELGMTLYTSQGTKIENSPETHKIVEEDYGALRFKCLRKKDSYYTQDIGELYSSEKSAIEAKLDNLYEIRDSTQKEINLYEIRLDEIC